MADLKNLDEETFQKRLDRAYKEYSSDFNVFFEHLKNDLKEGIRALKDIPKMPDLITQAKVLHTQEIGLRDASEFSEARVEFHGKGEYFTTSMRPHTRDVWDLKPGRYRIVLAVIPVD